MGQAIIQPSRMRRAFNGWCHGLFAGQYFERVLNLGCGHDYDRQGYMYSGYFDAKEVVRVDITDKMQYPEHEVCLCGRSQVSMPVNVIARAEDLSAFDNESFDMVFCNWVIYHCDVPKAVNEICRVLKPAGKLYVSYHCAKEDHAIYRIIAERLNILARTYLNMDRMLDGMDWLAEALWTQKK